MQLARFPFSHVRSTPPVAPGVHGSVLYGPARCRWANGQDQCAKIKSGLTAVVRSMRVLVYQPTPLFAPALYAFIAAMTPGPNNLMLLSSGLTFGFARTLPHMLGVSFGFLILTVAIVAGVGAAIMAMPTVRCTFTGTFTVYPSTLPPSTPST